MARRVVIVAALGACLGIAACPDAHIDGIGRVATGQWTRGDGSAERLVVDVSLGQRGVHAAPSAAVKRDQAQMRERRGRSAGQERVADLEPRVGAPTEAGVEVGAERGQSSKRS